MHKHCFYTKVFLHKTCFYTNPVFTQALSLHKHCFYTKAFLHKPCFYTNAVFTQALSLHKHCFYTRPAFTQKRFYTRPPFTQTLSLRKLCLYTSIAFIQALLLHNDILLTKAFCNLQTGNRLEGRRNAEGCKYIKTRVPTILTWTFSKQDKSYWQLCHESWKSTGLSRGLRRIQKYSKCDPWRTTFLTDLASRVTTAMTLTATATPKVLV